MANIYIRKITEDDVAILAEMTTEVQQLHHEGAPELFAAVPDDRSGFEEHIISFMENGTGYIAEIDGQAVGNVLYVIRDSPKNLFLQAHVRVHVDQMGVRPGFQGQGIGRQLMQQVITEAEKVGAQFITLNVYQFNQGAIHFYEAFGFECRNMTMKLDL